VGFYQEALQVLALHLQSLRETLPEGEIIVWDNGSCTEVVVWLQQRFHEGLIDYLHLSRFNLGKTGVLNWALGGLPHQYIGFSDGDIYFYPGWWEAVREVLDTFSQAGMVSPAPALFDVLRGQGRSAEMLQQQGWGIEECVVAQEDLYLYYRGLGRPVPADVAPALPCVQAPNGVRAFIGSGHHVFVMPREVARRLPPLPVYSALSTSSDRELHQRLEELGYVQLSTSRAFVYHMGNTPEVPALSRLPEAIRPRTQVRTAPPSEPISMKQRIKKGIRVYVQRHPWIKRKLERIYGGLFRLLYGE